MNKTTFTIHDVKEFVESNSECKLISSEYKNADSVLSLRCSCNKEFLVKFRYFKYQNKRACESCTDKKNGIINNLHSAKKLVSEKTNGVCEVVSDFYIDNKTPLEIKCGCGKIFECSITNIKQKKIIQCNFCAHSVFRMTKDKLIEIAQEASCKIINLDDYANENSKLKFRCKCGSEFETSLASFKENGKRCNACYKEDVSSSQRKDFDEVKKKVSETECVLLSDSNDYVNQYSKLRFKCPCGRKFSRSLTNFLRRDKLCPNCTSSKGEKAVSEVLTLKNACFKKEYSFDGLVSMKGNPLRFDFALLENGCVKSLIEYDGEFHYQQLINEELFLNQKYNDNLKDVYCKNNNIPLLRIPYFELENIENIIDEFLSIS